MDCIFCKIVKKEVGSSVIYEDDLVMAFLDINPLSRGHTLVIPKNHRENIFEIEDREISELYKVVKKISLALKKSLKCEGIKIEQRNGKQAGQEIMHFHTHLIPFPLVRSYEELDEIAKKIRESL